MIRLPYVAEGPARRPGWRLYEPSVSYADRAEIWDVVAQKRLEAGDSEGFALAALCAQQNRSLT